MAFNTSTLLLTILLVHGSTSGVAKLSDARVASVSSGRPMRTLRGRGISPQDSAADLRSKLHEAVNEALGEGNSVHHERLADIHKAILPMWQSLVKNRDGLVGLRTMRYAVHRYLLQSYGISFIGLEPHQTNDTLAEAEILTNRAPEYVRKVLEGKAASQGFSIEDVVALIATLETLISEDGQGMLEEAYNNSDLVRKKHSLDALSSEDVSSLLVTFVIRWILGPESRGLAHELESSEYQSVLSLVEGKVRSFEFDRLQSLQAARPWSQWNPLQPVFSFADVTLVADDIQKSFGEYNSGWCSDTKDKLAEKDAGRTGRVRLSNFHSDALDGDFHFGESKEYLRELGALDETSAQLGPQVIITNYLQAASNCIVQSGHYRVCCQNECEGIFTQLEEAIGGPVATPGELLAVIANMTGSLEEDAVKISPFLAKQLEDIAQASQGKVPLHGRLFAQWLHYAFPHECPFPHKVGTARASTTPKDFSGYKATIQEMEAHAALKEAEDHQNATLHRQLEDRSAVGAGPADKAVWMSQWSSEEELLADYAHLRSPWEAAATDSALLKPMLLLVAGGIAVVHRAWRRPSEAGLKDFTLPIASTKAHYI